MLADLTGLMDLRSDGEGCTVVQVIPGHRDQIPEDFTEIILVVPLLIGRLSSTEAERRHPSHLAKNWTEGF